MCERERDACQCSKSSVVEEREYRENGQASRVVSVYTIRLNKPLVGAVCYQDITDGGMF